MAGKPIVVANWKMHPATRADAKLLFAATKRIAEKQPSASIIVAPPSLYLSELARGYRGRALNFAAQHAREGDVGAFTGDISMAQVKDGHARYVLVGHAERRAAGESDEDTRKQIVSALANGLLPILCVGERQRDSGGEHLLFVKAQLRTALFDVDEKTVARVIIAYEPVWAIGAPEAMSPRQMHEMVIFIRKTIVEMRGAGGHNVKVLYGGAIDDTTAHGMVAEGDVSGLLVGRASTDAKEFSLLISSLSNKRS